VLPLNKLFILNLNDIVMSLIFIILVKLMLFFFYSSTPQESTAPNHLEPVRLWHPQLGYVVRLKVMGEEGDGNEEGGKLYIF